MGTLAGNCLPQFKGPQDKLQEVQSVVPQLALKEPPKRIVRFEGRILKLLIVQEETEQSVTSTHSLTPQPATELQVVGVQTLCGLTCPKGQVEQVHSASLEQTLPVPVPSNLHTK